MSRGSAAAGVIWITGLPASGKSTLAKALIDQLRGRGFEVAAVDSDEVRKVITPSPSYQQGERAIVYRAIAYVADRLSRAGLVAVVAATAHRASYRAWARSVCQPLAFVYARCSLATCRARDPKGLYAAADANPDNRLPGVGEPFEVPKAPDVVVDTEQPVEPGAVEALLDRLGYEG